MSGLMKKLRGRPTPPQKILRSEDVTGIPVDAGRPRVGRRGGRSSKDIVGPVRSPLSGDR